MNLDGLFIRPEFDKPEEYLSSSKRTEVTERIKNVSEEIKGKTSGQIVRNILVWINQNTIRLGKMDNSQKDNRKFKRTAEEILISKERTGCCDSATLFASLARAKGIPTMQIITFSKKWRDGLLAGEKIDSVDGHFFVACHLRDVDGNARWALIDPDDKYARKIEEVKIEKLDTNSRNVKRGYYAFAYCKDYSDVDYNGIKIDSISNMAKIQILACNMCNGKDLEGIVEGIAIE